MANKWSLTAVGAAVAVSATTSQPPITHTPASIYVNCSPLVGQNQYRCNTYVNNSLGGIRWYLSGVPQSTGSDQTVLSGPCYGSSAAGGITAIYTDPYGQQATGNSYAYC